MNAACERNLRELFPRVELRKDVTRKHWFRKVSDRARKLIDATGFKFGVQGLDTPDSEVAIRTIFLFRVSVHNVPLRMVYCFDTHSQLHVANEVCCRSSRVLKK